MYERVDTGSPAVLTLATDFAFSADDQALGAAGSVSSFTSTSSSSQKNVGTAVALRPAEIAFAAASSNGFEASGANSISISLSSAISLPVTAAYAVTSGTASGSGVDYTFTAGTASIAAGSTSASFSLTIVDDASPDGGATALDETVVFTLSSPTNSNVGAQSTHTFTIKDDEPKVSASVVDGAGAAVGSAWGGWTATAGSSNAASTNYLKVANIDPDPSGRPVATVDFTPATFAGSSDASWTITLDGNIQFSCKEDTTGSATPSSLTYPAFGAASGTGSASVTFTATTGSVFYCKHQVVALPDPARDQDYQAAFTVVGV
jgi:hypothetical protein